MGIVQIKCRGAGRYRCGTSKVARNLKTTQQGVVIMTHIQRKKWGDMTAILVAAVSLGGFEVVFSSLVSKGSPLILLAALIPLAMAVIGALAALHLVFDNPAQATQFENNRTAVVRRQLPQRIQNVSAVGDEMADAPSTEKLHSRFQQGTASWT
jgi:hypothetical protein